MKKQHFLHKNKTTRSLVLRTRSKNMAKGKTAIIASAVFDKMDADEKIELFQQLEIAQGVRIGVRSVKALSPESQKILSRYDAIQTARGKKVYAEKIKSQVFSSIKKGLAVKG